MACCLLVVEDGGSERPDCGLVKIGGACIGLWLSCFAGLTLNGAPMIMGAQPST